VIDKSIVESRRPFLRVAEPGSACGSQSSVPHSDWLARRSDPISGTRLAQLLDGGSAMRLPSVAVDPQLFEEAGLGDLSALCG
jgi:hypothetical protein